MTKQARIALATGTDMPVPDPETHLLTDALAHLGIAADRVPWQADRPWADYSLVVSRTPWDYFTQLPAFLDWVRRTAGQTHFLNPAAVIEWNCHKAYLRRIAELGIPTVPTLWLDRGQRNGASRLRDNGWGQVVIKPAVSIGAIGALRGDARDAACAAHLNGLLAEGDAMVQPFVASIAEAGEASLVFFGGRFSHAIRKLPQPGDFRVQEIYGGTVHSYSPTAAELELAAAALALTPEPTTYARVDVVWYGGVPVVMELELIEPELFLAMDGAATRFAEALAERLG